MDNPDDTSVHLAITENITETIDLILSYLGFIGVSSSHSPLVSDSVKCMSTSFVARLDAYPLSASDNRYLFTSRARWLTPQM